MANSEVPHCKVELHGSYMNQVLDLFQSEMIKLVTVYCHCLSQLMASHVYSILGWVVMFLAMETSRYFWAHILLILI